MKVSLLGLRAMVVTFFSPTSSIYLVVSRALEMVNNLKLSSKSAKLISALLKTRNNIPKTYHTYASVSY